MDGSSYPLPVLVTAHTCQNQNRLAHRANLSDASRRYANAWSVEYICWRVRTRNICYCP